MFKHISSKNANYGATEQYLTFEYDEFTMKLILDENGRLIPRDGLKAQKSEKARKAYREQHESEFIIAEAATRYFKAHGISKLPASKALQVEIEQFTREKNALYNEYREKKGSVRELQTVKSNIEQILRREPERRKEQAHDR